MDGEPMKININGVEFETDSYYDPARLEEARIKKISTLAGDRSNGVGIEYTKLGKKILYRGAAIISYVERGRRPTSDGK